MVAKVWSMDDLFDFHLLGHSTQVYKIRSAYLQAHDEMSKSRQSKWLEFNRPNQFYESIFWRLGTKVSSMSMAGSQKYLLSFD